MTSAGGMFYNMQEKQGNTLFGMWAKLGDAASVMYDEIGNTDSVNSAMKDTIQLLTDLMKNWRLVGRELLVFGATMGVIAIKSKAQAVATTAQSVALNKVRNAGIAYDAILAEEARLQGVGTAAQLQSVAARKANAKAALDAAIAERTAATSTGLWARSMDKLKAALMGNWLTIAISAIAAIGMAIYSAYEKANKLKNELKDIQDSGAVESTKSVFTFQRLANAALEAANGSKEQKEALDELARTYKDVIPSEQLSLENLRKLREQGYEPLTAAIKEYIAQRTLQKEIDAITSNYTDDIVAKQRELRELFRRGSSFNFFSGTAWTPIEGLDDDQISQVFANIEKIAQDKSKKWEDVWVEAIKGVTNVSEEAEVKMRSMFVNERQNAQQTSYNNKMRDIVENTRAMATETDAASKRMESQTGYLGEYKKVLDQTSKSLAGFRAFWSDGTAVNDKSFLYSQMLNNASIKAWKDDIVEDLQSAGVTIKDEWFKIVKSINPKDYSQMSAIDFAPILDAIESAQDQLGEKYAPLKKAIQKYQELYNGIVPTDATVSVIRKKYIEIADATKDGFIDKVKSNLMGADESLKDYQKKIKDTGTDLADTIKSLTATLAITPMVSLEYGKLSDELKDAKEKKEFYDKILALLPNFDKNQGNGHTSDPRLGILQEMVSTLKQVNKEYDELSKKEGATKALADTQRVYADTFKNMQQLAAKYKFDLPDFGVPTDAALLTKYLNAIKSAMAKLPKSDKAVLALQVDIEKLNIDDMQKRIEQKLKSLSDRISRTKTAREFYDKILSQTGDIDLAMNVSMSVYGDTGEGLFDNLVEQIRQSFTSGDAGIDLQIEAEIDAAIDTTNQRINYQKLAEIYEKYQNDIIEKNRDTAQKIVSEGQKTAAANILTWEKELAKAKDYEEQRTDIINRETQRRAEIYKSNLPQEEKDRLAAQSRKKQDEDVAKLNFEEFTKSKDYIKIFENLDNTSTAALKRLREEMRKLIETNKDLSPENMKTLVKAMEDIDEQISGRGFGNDMVQSVRDYVDALRDLKTARAELQTVQAEYDAQLPQLDADITTAKDEEIAAQEALNALKAQKLRDGNAIVAAELRLNNATTAVTNAEQAKAKAAEKVKEAETKVTNQQDKQRKATTKFVKDFQKIASEADQLANTLGEVKDLLGISEDSASGLVFDSAVDSLQMVSKAIGIATTAQAVFNAVAESNPYVALAAGVLAVGAAIGSWISGNKVRKANKEIKKQQQLLEQLEYVYGRLEKAADKVFGTDYLNNYNRQVKNLQAQAQAYQKQAAAERSKGKKADKDKIKEYENAARDTADEIADLMDDLVAHFTGSSKQDIARQMAQSWIDARASMSDTFAAIKSDYSEMIKNMIVEGAAARIIENALSPMWDNVDKMLEKNDIEGAIDALINGMDTALSTANNGMEVLWQALEAKGYDLKQLIGDVDSSYTGIKREVAGASSEEMNANTAALHVQNYYLSQVPGIAVNVSLIRQYMESGNASVGASTSAAGWTDWQQQAMDSYLAIQRNTADTVVECRRAAVAAENAVTELKRVIVPKGVKGTHGVQVYM